MEIKKARIKTGNNFAIYEIVQHNKCVICSKFIMYPFLSTLEVRKREAGCALLLGYSILHIPQYFNIFNIFNILHIPHPQTLRVVELVPTAKMSKKI